MDQRPVSGAWKLKAPHDTAVQGLVVAGFASLPTGRALFLEFHWADDDHKRGRWLAALETIAPVTDANGKDIDADGKAAPATALAFTCSGLASMGLPAAALDSFAAPFREGMLQEDRLRRIGDRRNGAWQGTVIADGPIWSGNTPQRGVMASAPDVKQDDRTATGHMEEAVATVTTVHALLMLYDPDPAAADARASAVKRDLLTPFGIAVVHELALDLRPDPVTGIAREHFGFADGVSQPVPFDDTAITPADPQKPRDPWNGIPLGDILMGYANSHHEVAPSPMAAPIAGAPDSGLPPHPLAEGFLDLGLDGSYMVVRQLRQNVAAFWNSMDAAAGKIRAGEPGATEITADWLADRVIGRDRDGNLLCPLDGAVTKADADANSFGFFERDRHGHGCPVGSHVRRANPRDGLAPNPGDRQTLLEAANNHRLLRRGRKYGDDAPADRMSDDRKDRGLLFMALNTDLGRQFEFVQQTWMLNKNFATLYDESDPLLGPAGPLTVPGSPIRRICDVDTFVQLVGGDYFFLPSLPALKYLAAL